MLVLVHQIEDRNFRAVLRKGDSRVHESQTRASSGVPRPSACTPTPTGIAKPRLNLRVGPLPTASSPAKLTAASHHMYQIIAKPKTTLSPASTTPTPVLLGIWMGLKPCNGRV